MFVTLCDKWTNGSRFKMVSNVFTLFEVNPTALLSLFEYALIDEYIEIHFLHSIPKLRNRFIIS